MLAERLGGGSPPERLAWPPVELGRDSGELVRTVAGEVGAAGKVLAQQPVGVLVGPTLPGAAGIAEVDLQTAVEPQLDVLGHLDALIPRQRPPQLLRQGADRLSDRVADRPGPGAGDRRAAVDPGAVVTFDRREMQQHREPTAALDQSADRGSVGSEDQIAFPVPRNGPVSDLGGTLADQHVIGHEAAVALRRAVSWGSQRSTGSQACGQFASQRSAALDIQRLIDRLAADPPRPIIGEVEPPSPGNLLWTPRSPPAPVLAWSMTPTAPSDLRTRDVAVESLHRAGKAVLDIVTQPRVGHQLGGLRSPRAAVGMGLRGRRPVFRPASPHRGVALQLSGDRRWCPPEPASDRSHSMTAGEQHRDLFALYKRQIPPGHRREGERRHPATLPKPPDTNRRQAPCLYPSVLARGPPSDRPPKPDPMLATSSWRTSLAAHPRRHSTSQRGILPLHRNSSSSSVATTS